MKNRILNKSFLLVLLVLFRPGSHLSALNQYISLNPIGLVSGYVALEYERAIPNTQLTWRFSPVFYNASLTNFLDDKPVGYGQDADDTAWGANISAGMNFYFQPEALSGFYAGGLLTAGLLEGYITTYDATPAPTGGDLQKSFNAGLNFNLGYKWSGEHFSISPHVGMVYMVIFGNDYSGAFATDQPVYRISMNPNTVFSNAAVVKLSDGMLFSAHGFLGCVISFGF